MKYKLYYIGASEKIITRYIYVGRCKKIRTNIRVKYNKI